MTSRIWIAAALLVCTCPAASLLQADDAVPGPPPEQLIPSELNSIQEDAETFFTTANTSSTSYFDDEQIHYDGQHYSHTGQHGHSHSHSLKHGRPDSHAPAGLMGDHVHEKGEYMLEYKYIFMQMEDNRVGNTRISDAASLNALGNMFAATPTRMDMHMHMLHFMYAPSDNVTLYIMPMLMQTSMDHLRRMAAHPLGPTFRTNNVGFGDTPMGALWRIYETHDSDLILNLGFSIPTASLDETTTRVNGMPLTLPYPMRFGSGTFDARPGITYKKYWKRSSMGMQFQSDLPIGTNWEGYSEGNSYQTSIWFAQLLKDNLSASVRLEWLRRDNFSGADPRLASPPAPPVSTTRTDMRGGDWFNVGLGSMYQFEDGSRLNFEWVIPVYQDLKGVQLETDYQMFVSWSKAFD